MAGSRIRRAAFAGSWYPAAAADCEREIESFLAGRRPDTASRLKPLGGIVPHAGWYFSGQIACRVFDYLKRAGGPDPDPDVFLVFGMHLHSGAPRHMMAEGAWETPFGEIQVDEEVAAALAASHGFVLETADRFAPDNTIELQLPFLKYFFESAKIVAIGMPPHDRSIAFGTAAADTARRLGRRILVIGSTDLTHYGANYGFMAKGSGPEAVAWVREENDRRLIEAILDLDPQKVIEEGRLHQNACCAGAVATAIAAARRLGATDAEPIAYATSYDKHPGDSFVGYVGVVLGTTW